MKMLIALPLLTLALFSAAPVAAETVNCTNITSLPAVLATQGVYCLKQDLATSIASGNAITIAANNVTLDCNNFKIGGASAGPTTATNGVRADNRTNVAVRNCNIRGFYEGVSFVGGNGHTIEDNRIDLSTHAGIWFEGDSSVIRRNRIAQTGPSAQDYAIGIAAGGTVDVLDNAVIDVVARAAPPSTAVGINAWLANGREVSGNRVSGLEAASFRYGIQLGFGNHAVARDNTVAMGIQTTQPTDVGIECFTTDGFVARDNVVLGFISPAIAIHRCVDSGNVASG